MAMEFRHAIMDIHPKPVLCVQYNPFRREIMTAGEEFGNQNLGNFFHVGQNISDGLPIYYIDYSKELKVLFSSSIDGYIIAWGPSGKPLQKIQTGSPVYCLAYNFRRQQIMAGQNKKVRLFQLIGEDALSKVTTDVLEKKSVSCSEHLDIVSCLVSCEGRFYSAGYDRKIVIYDVPHHGDLKLRVASTIKDAHDASISCMIFGKDADNSWLITGSIDRVVKLWSLDGNLMQRFDGFNDTITSLCYVIPTQTLWVTANSPLPVVYDPRSGINVSDFVRTDDDRFHVRGGTFGFRNLLYIPETMEVVAISTRRSLVVWKYNSVAPLTVLPGHIDIAECLAFNSKEPILIFSGGDDGIIHKWERLQLNTFMYSQEALVLPKEEFNDVVVEPPPAVIEKKSLKTVRMKRRFDRGPAPKEIKAAVDTFLPKTKKETVVPNKTKAIRPGVVSMSYFEDLDLLISGYEDSRIQTHGMGSDSKTDERVTSRVAGMSLKVTLCEHKDAVTALSCFKKDGASWLLSTGWDRKICLWNLNELRLQDVFKNSSATSPWKEELAADGIILDLEYSSERNEFGYCSSDKLAYIRKFSTNGANMKLQAAAEGIPMLRVINNDGPVTAICVDTLNKCIITGSQDKVIRVFDIEKKDEIVQKHMGHSDEIRSIIHIPSRNQYVSAAWDNTVRVWNAFLKKGQRKATKTVTKYAPEEDENVQSYSEMNPLIIPKLLSKPVFVKEFVLEKAPVKEDDDEIEKSALEEELRQTLNDLDAALNSPDVIIILVHV
ncbi:hypothetical protein HDV02_005118 [Globomyces sp. JEL0801]|nr:hypothetical protein HDV02_005118 [Globomyces sp. JEL0801]